MIERIQRRLLRALKLQGTARAIRTHSGTALGSSIGLVRKRNEDCCLVARVSYATRSHASFTVAVICDGLGGMSQGQEAAILAASAFTSRLFSTPALDLSERLHQAIAYANAEVYQALRGDGGTTLSAVINCARQHAMLCHVGDSRIYGISPDRALEQLSRDDTINAALNKQKIEAETPKDSRLLQFVGMGDEMEAQIKPIPNQFRSVLVTSDGAHDVPSSVLQRIVMAAAGGSDLIHKLLTLSDMLGGRDNASAILLPISSETGPYDETNESELIAILPHDTVSVYVADLEASETQGQRRNDSPENLRQEPIKKMGDASPKRTVVIGEPTNPKPAAPKVKGRSTKSRSRKRQPVGSTGGKADRLPLGERNDEVDVKISFPTPQADDDKK